MESGGSERQMLQLLRGLDRARFAADLYLTYATGPMLPLVPPDVTQHAYASRQAERPGTPGGIYLGQVRLVRKILRQRRIGVCYDRLYHTVMVTALAARRLPVRRVVTVVAPPSFAFGRSQQRWMGIKRAVLRYSHRSAHRLIAVSEESARDAAEFYSIDRDRFEILPSPVDIAAVRGQAAVPPPPLFERGPELNIAVVGRLSEEKNHRLLLQAMAMLKARGRSGIRLHLVGDGPLRAELRNQAEEAGIGGMVHFYGVLDAPHAVTTRCDVMCLPSLFEGFSNVVMEAMACRVPVLASRTAGGLDVLLGESGERGERLPPEDAAAWADRLAAWPPENLAQRVEAAAGYVADHHDLPVWIGRMQQIFCEEAGNRVD